MVQSDFERLVGAKAVCLFRSQFGFVVEAFNGNGASGSKPVTEQVTMHAECERINEREVLGANENPLPPRLALGSRWRQVGRRLLQCYDDLGKE